MTVVADTSPVHYLVLIGEIDVLAPLFGRVLVPQTVADELAHAAAPEVVRRWIAQPPRWLDVRPDPAPDAALATLDPGERAALSLAVSLGAHRLLVDDWDGRREAIRRHVLVTGTLGVLAAAHQRQLLDIDVALTHLSRTSFYMSTELVDTIRRRLPPRRRSP